MFPVFLKATTSIYTSFYDHLKTMRSKQNHNKVIYKLMVGNGESVGSSYISNILETVTHETRERHFPLQKTCHAKQKLNNKMPLSSVSRNILNIILSCAQQNITR